MNYEVIFTCLLIIIARIADVSLGTIRTISVIHGRRITAWALGFVEVLIWVIVVSKVIENLSEPVYAIAYALGFATGNFVGITIESRIAFGEQVVRVFTRKGPEVSAVLREAGYRATQFEGQGRDGHVYMLFVETVRRDSKRVIAIARKLDPNCFYVVDDVRFSSNSLVRAVRGPGWRALVRK